MLSKFDHLPSPELSEKDNSEFKDGTKFCVLLSVSTIPELVGCEFGR